MDPSQGAYEDPTKYDGHPITQANKDKNVNLHIFVKFGGDGSGEKK